jgi:hypothetical protein
MKTQQPGKKPKKKEVHNGKQWKGVSQEMKHFMA